MKIKLLCFLVAIVMVVVGLASCKPDNGGTGSGNGEPKGDYYWGSSTIKIAMYENDNAGELSSGLTRYYAGKDESANTQLDTDIRARNGKATEVTGVNATYDSVKDYAWGGSIQRIPGETSVNSDAMPDVYINFVYDMTSLAIRGCFKNLYTNTAKSSVKVGEGQNYFAFTKDGYKGIGSSYFDSTAGGGYFYDYMQSLSLANANGEYDKMYVLASDYCVDLVRAFLVMPVNVDMMKIDIADSWTDGTYVKDQDKDGDHDIDDFYKLVWDGGWTYDALAEYANAVFQPTGDDANAADIKDVLGVAFGQTSGLTASGLLYTSDVEIIQRNGGSYAYPASNSDLDAYAAALNSLFADNANKGVCHVNKGVFNSNSDLGDIAGIRDRFGEGNYMLFGGIIALGSLEEKAYQDMTGDTKSGFGVVCVPMYKEGTVEDYRTLVHNIARLPAISANTTEFEQCTAFFDYQSTNSSKILDTYYNQVLMGLVNSGAAKENNVKMLTFIRNHVRDCFDKTFEDVVSAYMKSNGNTQADAQRWHQYFRDARYQVTNLPYTELVGDASQKGSKAYNFNTILNEWKNLK